MEQPFAVAVGGDGSVYVADTLNHRIQKFGMSTPALGTTWGRVKAMYLERRARSP
jgi:hypothetical protein